MGWLTHVISGDHFAALAAGGGGREGARALGDVQYSRNVLLVAAVVAEAAGTGAPARAARARADLARLLALCARAPLEARGVLGHPSVGVWALETLHGPAARADAGPVAALAAAVALRSRLPGEHAVPVRDGAVMLPSVGRAALGASAADAVVRVAAPGGRVAARVTAGGRTVEIPAATGVDGPGWRGLRRVSAAAAGHPLDLLVDDVDPHRFPPGLAVAPRLGADALAGLRASLGAAWLLLARHHPAVAAEAGALLSTVTPLAADPAGHASATAREAFGCVAFSVPVDARQLAVTLAHEVQHAKLTALMDALPLLPADTGRRYYAPWRPDPRPLAGLLHGTYAFLGVTGFWRRQRRHDRGERAFLAHVEFARWRAAVRVGLDQLLAEPALPPLGARFVRGMRGTLDSWSADPVPDAAARAAARALDEHRAAWRHDHGALPAGGR